MISMEELIFPKRKPKRPFSRRSSTEITYGPDTSRLSSPESVWPFSQSKEGVFLPKLLNSSRYWAITLSMPRIDCS